MGGKGWLSGCPLWSLILLVAESNSAESFCLYASNTIKKTTGQFVSVNMPTKLNQGDHFRIINKTQNIIWEIYGIDVPPIDLKESYTYFASTLSGIKGIWPKNLIIKYMLLLVMEN